MSYVNRDYWSTLHDDLRGRLSAVGYAGMGDGFNRAAYEIRLRAAERLLDKGGAVPLETVIEGAVGVGAYGHLWKALGAREWVGLDISPTAVGELRSRFPEHTFVAVDLSSAADPSWSAVPPSAGLVTAIDVLYHLTDDAAFTSALQNLAKRVAPGGRLMVSDVFVEQPVQVASHVRRRPLAAYEEVLAPLGFSLVTREPVFGILGDPVRRRGFHPTDELLFGAWRVLQKVVRTTPTPLRDAVGNAVVRGLTPLDRLSRDLGLAEGVNLELALFRRSETRGS